MQKSALLHTLREEIRRHNMDTFVVDPPSMAEGGKVGGRPETWIAGGGLVHRNADRGWMRSAPAGGGCGDGNRISSRRSPDR